MKNKNRVNGNINMLAADPETAMRQLVVLTRKLVEYGEQETAALVRGDMIRLAAVQDDKEKMAHKYTKASEEFRARIAEFRGIDRALLNELEGWQGELSRKTDENNVLLSRTRSRQFGSTPATLLSAQDLGQNGGFMARRSVNVEHKGA